MNVENDNPEINDWVFSLNPFHEIHIILPGVLEFEILRAVIFKASQKSFKSHDVPRPKTGLFLRLQNRLSGVESKLPAQWKWQANHCLFVGAFYQEFLLKKGCISAAHPCMSI